MATVLRGKYKPCEVPPVVGVGEWTARGIMEEEGLVAHAARKRRRYGSYEDEIFEAPENLLRADRPNELWTTDVTEFRVPAGKVYLSSVVDCFDGMPLSWPISTSPDAEMANSSLLGAYLRWYRDARIKSDLGYRSPMQYRRDLGLAIWDEFGPSSPPQSPPQKEMAIPP